MSNIIEKLGIIPTKVYFTGTLNPGTPVCLDKNVIDLEQQRNKLLNLAISIAEELEKYYEILPGYTPEEFNFSDDFEGIIGKPWHEIKELSNE